VTFARLRTADWVAMVAAIALLFVMAADWYSTATGEEARRIEGLTDPEGAQGGEIERDVQEEARVTAEGEEQNAWQADGGIDRVILAVLLAAVACALAAGFFRAAGRRFRGPLTPSALAGLLAAAGALLLSYRLIQEPGFDEATTVQAGAPIAIAVLGVLAYAAATALRAEDQGKEFREVAEEEKPAT
jgi:hypothetical protein